MALEVKVAYDRAPEVAVMLEEYTQSIMAMDEQVKAVLQSQHYGEELADLEGKYGMPDGRLYLAYWDGELAGTIALRKVDAETCEMKRLYVRPAFRSKHVGGQLARQVIADAQAIGYRHMLLDTLYFMKDAIRLYERLGFVRIDKYYDNPMESAIYMRLDL